MDAVLVSERATDEVFATVVDGAASTRAGRTARLWLAGHPLPVLLDGTTRACPPDEAAGVALGVLDGRTAGRRSTARSRTRHARCCCSPTA